MIQATERLIESKDGYTFVFLVLLILFIVAKAIYGKHLVFANYFLFTNAHVLNDDKETSVGFNFIMLLISSLTFGLLLHLIVIYYGIESPYILPEILFLYTSGGVFLYLLISYFICKLLGEILDVKELTHVYIVFKVSYLKTIVLFLVPLLLIVVYSPFYNFYLLKVTVSCTLLLFVLRLLFIWINNKNLILNELFYFILYICTLEIAPLMIILRLTS